MTITTVPDEETPLLGRQQAATLTSLSNPTPSINGETKRDAAKRTPLPWAQFSITLFLQLAEPLISQVISPVSTWTRLLFTLTSVSPDTGGGDGAER